MPPPRYLLSIYARADHPGALVGVNVNGQLQSSLPILVGGYQIYSMGFFAQRAGDVIRVWMYAPGVAGLAAIDDAVVAESPLPQ